MMQHPISNHALQPDGSLRQQAERGSALLVVTVVMLVLSVICAALITMSEEDRSRANDNRFTREALFAAESGLRRGEQVLLAAGSLNADTLLQHLPVAHTEALSPAVPLFPQRTGEYDLQHLGTYLTEAGVELANQQVEMAPPPPDEEMPLSFYSLYLRNNPDDSSVADGQASTDAREDDDLVVRLVSVGWVLWGEVQAVKILEEEYTWAGLDQTPSAQKLLDAGGTSSVLFGG